MHERRQESEFGEVQGSARCLQLVSWGVVAVAEALKGLDVAGSSECVGVSINGVKQFGRHDCIEVPDIDVSLAADRRTEVFDEVDGSSEVHWVGCGGRRVGVHFNGRVAGGGNQEDLAVEQVNTCAVVPGGRDALDHSNDELFPNDECPMFATPVGLGSDGGGERSLAVGNVAGDRCHPLTLIGEPGER